MGTTSPFVPRAELCGDEAELFRRHHRDLLRLVARDVNAGPQVIEDACAFAWLEFLARQPQRTNPVGWLRVVARREAIRLARHDRRAAALEPHRADACPGPATGHATQAKEALRAVAALPDRRRAVLTLQIAGHSYREIGQELRMTPRTVERQLVRARAAVRRERDAPARAA